MCSWRGPVWFPVNYLLVERLQVLDHYYGSSLVVELPAGSGNKATLWGVASDISERLIDIFRRAPSPAGGAPAPQPQAADGGVPCTPPRAADGGRPPRYAPGERPVHGGFQFFSSHPRFAELIPFFEFFNGDNGTGLGARQQTGWTAMVAKLLQQSASTRLAESHEAAAAAAQAAGAGGGAGATAGSAGAPSPWPPGSAGGAGGASTPTAVTSGAAAAAAGGGGGGGTVTKAKPAVRLPGRLNLGPIDTGTALDLHALAFGGQQQ